MSDVPAGVVCNTSFDLILGAWSIALSTAVIVAAAPMATALVVGVCSY